MNKSMVCLLVLLAVCSLSLTLVPTALSQADSIKVLSYTWYVDSIDYLTVVGEVQNVGINTVDSVLLTGTATASDGTIVGSTTQAYAINLVPQQKAPFYMEFPPSEAIGNDWYSAGVSGVNIVVRVANATANYQYPDVKITNKQASIGSGSTDKGVYWVNGEIKNTGSQTAQNIRVIGTFYNASGAVVAVGGYINDVVAASLAPSATATFKFGAFDINQTGIPSDRKITDYSLVVLVEEPILQGTPPSIAPTTPASPATSQSPSDTSTSTSTQPSGSNPTGSLPSQWIYAIVVVVAVVAVATALLLLKKRSHHT